MVVLRNQEAKRLSNGAADPVLKKEGMASLAADGVVKVYSV
jgi:hypothetical protein